MLFDSLILTALTEELSQTLLKGKIERVSQPTPLELILRIYIPGGGKQNLLFSCEPETARVHFTSIARENPPQPPAFCMLLRKYLDGARIESVSMPLGFGERILQIEFRAFDGAPLTLIAELMGRNSNVVLINGLGIVLGAMKHISREINRVRETLPNKPYVAPPKQRIKLDPFKVFQSEDPEELSQQDAEKWLLSAFLGVSPLLAREAILRVTGPFTRQAIWYGLSDVLNVVRVGDYAPIVWSDEHGNTLGAYPMHLKSVSEKNQYSRPTMSVALDNAAASLDVRETYEHVRDALQAALHKTRRSREKDRDDLTRGIENADRADEYKESGDLIQANMGSIEKGQTTVTVVDYFRPAEDSGEPTRRVIALDPVLSPRENAERYYKKARKARDSRALLTARKIGVDEEISVLLRAESDVAEATSVEKVASIRERIASLLSRNAQRATDPNSNDQPERQAPAFEGHKIRKFMSVDGWEILVGENATSNDYLTTKVASPSDIWLHVRAATSAHGVIRAQNRPGAVSSAALQQAAELVAARSEVKHSSLIPVDYTLKKHVRKPRKSAPGSVTYQNEKTLYVQGINQ